MSNEKREVAMSTAHFDEHDRLATDTSSADGVERRTVRAIHLDGSVGATCRAAPPGAYAVDFDDVPPTPLVPDAAPPSQGAGLTAGPEPASRLPWLTQGHDTEAAETGSGDCVVVTLGQEVAARNLAAIVHRVNNWDALCYRVEVAEATVKLLATERDDAKNRHGALAEELNAAMLRHKLWGHGTVVAAIDALAKRAEECEGALRFDWAEMNAQAKRIEELEARLRCLSCEREVVPPAECDDCSGSQP